MRIVVLFIAILIALAVVLLLASKAW